MNASDCLGEQWCNRERVQVWQALFRMEWHGVGRYDLGDFWHRAQAIDRGAGEDAVRTGDGNATDLARARR